MNNRKSPLQPVRIQGDSALAGELVAAGMPDSAECRRREERLVRLFTHAGENADARYLRDLVTRYRGPMSS